MTKPASITDFGTLLPANATACARTRHPRFADVKTYAANAMPVVKVGQIYEDLDPRSIGRRIQVLRVGTAGKVMVRTLAPRTCAPRTPSQTQRDTTGDISFISLRRFRENSRGFRLVRGSAVRSVNAYLLASRLAAECDIAISEMETRAADALIGLLGNSLAHEYLDALIDSDAVTEVYLIEGIGFMLRDALAFADETDMLTDAWKSTEVATKHAARTAASNY